MSPDTDGEPEQPAKAGRQARKQVLLRLDPQVYDALARWAGEELRSANAQIEFLLRPAPWSGGLGGARRVSPYGRQRPRTSAEIRGRARFRIYTRCVYTEGIHPV